MESHSPLSPTSSSSAEEGHHSHGPVRKIKAKATEMLSSIGKGIVGRKSLKHEPEDFVQRLSAPAKNLLVSAFHGIDSGALLDYHCHIIGFGAGGTGCYVTAADKDVLTAQKSLTFGVMSRSAGVSDEATADQDFVARLLRLIRAYPRHGRYVTLAFDQNHDAQGVPHPEDSEFYTPNEYIWELGLKHSDAFVPSCSVHPARPDAIKTLEFWASKGVRQIKWLPNSMNINPANESYIPYYNKVRDLGMFILSHAGEEKAVEAHPEQQCYGNPQLLKLPLSLGVRIICAHCASLGQSEDLDHPGPQRPKVDNFKLFLRMLENKEWEGLLFGDISATIQVNRMEVLSVLLKRTDIHHRLVNGSDYPLPAVPLLVMTRPFVRQGLINSDEREALNEIYSYNPLLFDFCLKRTIRGPENQRFPPAMFMQHPLLQVMEVPERIPVVLASSSAGSSLNPSAEPSRNPSRSIASQYSPSASATDADNPPAERFIQVQEVEQQVIVLEQLLIQKRDELKRLQDMLAIDASEVESYNSESSQNANN